MRNFKMIGVICALPVLTNCASKPGDIAAVPYPDQVFKVMTCDQIKAEYIKIEDSVLKITGQQRSERKKDQGISLATGMLLGNSSLLFTQGNSETASQLALIKGKYESISRVSAAKNCAIDSASE